MEVCRFDDELREVSGLAASTQHAGVLWLHEDSGSGPELIAIDSQTCERVARLTVAGAKARDFEALGIGEMPDGSPAIWLGDIGDNLDSWPYVEILRIREPAQLRNQSVPSRAFRFTYDDAPHNAEALLVHDTQLWVVTKQLARGALYRLPDPILKKEVNTATRVQDETGLVTDGSIAPDGSRYVLRDYFDAQMFDGLPPGTLTQTIELPAQVQGEAIAFSADGRALFVASERDRRLFRMDLTTAVEPTAEPTADTNEAMGEGETNATPVLVVGVACVLVAAIFVLAEVRRRRVR